MFSFFKKLFGINKTTKEPMQETFLLASTSIRIEVSSPVNTILIPKKVEKTYDISEIKKQSTKIKDKEGFLASVDFLKTFIASNNIEFSELISLLKKLIPYMKKEKNVQNEDILEYVNSQINRFNDKNQIENFVVIAEILSRVNNKQGLEYLEKKLGGFETDKQKTLLHFDALILLSDFYLVDKQGDNAFKTISRCMPLVTNFKNKFDYLIKQKIIAEKSAKICLSGQLKPQYSDYIYYEIVAFILEICRDIIAFPHLSRFFYRKNICFNNEWGFETNEHFVTALEDLRITKYKKELLNDIYNFTFNDLPLKMGIPKKYLNQQTLDSFFDNFELNYLPRQELMKVTESLNNVSLDVIVVIIHRYTTTLVNMYYDLENMEGSKD